MDELHVVLQLGHAKAPDPPKKTSGSNSYGFADKVVEGLSIKINVLDVSFESDSFSGSIWVSFFKNIIIINYYQFSYLL